MLTLLPDFQFFWNGKYVSEKFEGFIIYGFQFKIF